MKAMKAWIRFRGDIWEAYSDPMAAPRSRIANCAAELGPNVLADQLEALGFRLAQSREALATYERLAKEC